jgi:hypothetical protein
MVQGSRKNILAERGMRQNRSGAPKRLISEPGRGEATIEFRMKQRIHPHAEGVD